MSKEKTTTIKQDKTEQKSTKLTKAELKRIEADKRLRY